MNEKPLPKDVEELLPWYVKGTLNEAETDRVAAVLETTGNGAKVLDSEVALSQRFAETPPELDQILKERDRSYESLRSRLTVAPGRVSQRRPDRRSARSRGLFAALSIGVLAAVAAISWWSAPLPQINEYTTLSENQAPGFAVVVQVAVRADVTREQTQKLADHLHASIVSGPSPRNVYRFALPTRSEAAADLQWLRSQPEVAFADVQVP
jgi:hypothetical protein